MNNCISKRKLFDYYHAELEQDEMDIIDVHLNDCKSCKSVLSQIENEVDLMKESFYTLNPEITEIPEFIIKKKYILNKYSKRKILSWAASICLLVTVSTIVTHKIIDNQRPVNDYEYFEYIPDLNDAWKENSITITHYDKEGNPINHEVIRD